MFVSTSSRSTAPATSASSSTRSRPLHLKNVTVSNANTYDAYIYGDGSELEFLGSPMKNITLDNVWMEKATKVVLYSSGSAKNIIGNITMIEIPLNCLAK